jgi:hypothetical protein
MCVWLAQAVRKATRNAVNSIFVDPISKGSSPELQAIAKLITGKSPNADDSSQSMSLIHYDHKLRDSLSDRTTFVLCPVSAKNEKSSLHNLSTDTQKDFFKLLQNTGRIVPLFDKDGKQVDLLAQDTFAQHTVDSPMFNILTGYFFFNAMAKGPRMADIFVAEIEQRADGTYSMSKIFEKRVITSTGEKGEYLLGPRFMALLDFYVATSIYGGIPAAQDHRGFFELRARQYGVMTGVDGSRDMRKELQTVLEDYLNRFPFKIAQVRRARKSGSSFATPEVVDLTEEELRDGFATGPAGGAISMQLPSGKNPSAMGAGTRNSAEGAEGSAADRAGEAGPAAVAGAEGAPA